MFLFLRYFFQPSELFRIANGRLEQIDSRSCFAIVATTGL